MLTIERGLAFESVDIEDLVSMVKAENGVSLSVPKLNLNRIPKWVRIEIFA